jgi:hypothetical protein
MSPAHESLVELRCAVAVVRRDAVLALERHDHGDRVLPSGRPLIGGFLPDLPRPGGAPGRYLGNVWHPQRGDP